MKDNASQIPVMVHLRGLAALSVCLCHFAGGNPNLLPDSDPLRVIGKFGDLGVEAFFVISGFVLPYSLYLRSYKLRDVGSFFIRRLKRIEPPYFACIAFTLLVKWAASVTPGYKGEPVQIMAGQLLAHIGYLNGILGYEWINGVFWTLAIEFQFYLLISVCFPLLVNSRSGVRIFSVALLACIGIATPGEESKWNWLSHWMPLFALGMAAFQYYVRQTSRAAFLLLAGFVTFVSLVSIGTAETIVGLLTASAILWFGCRRLPRFMDPLASVGIISYSLYLTHPAIGTKISNLATRLPQGSLYRYSGVLAAFAVSLLGAYVFWYIFERPAQNWSKGVPKPSELDLPNRSLSS